MNQNPFVDGTTLVDLGRGSGIAIWGFRACAQGKAACPCVQKGFDTAFADKGAHIIECIRFFAHCVSRFGRRKVGLAAPGHVHVTRDEASILATISAAQVCDRDTRDAHLAWLLAGPAPLALKRTVDEIAYGFAEEQVIVRSPEYQQPDVDEKPQLRLVAAR